MTEITRNPSHRHAPWESVDAEDISGLDINEAIKVAGLDYHVAKVPHVAEIALPESNNPALRLPRKVELPDSRLTVNETVGDGWTPEWAGRRKGGAQTFMFGKLPYEMQNMPDVQPYMGFLNSFDGSTALRVASTAMVPSCTNALSTTFYGKSNNAKSVFSFKHTANIWSRIDAAREALQLQVAWAQEMDRQIGALMNRPLSTDGGNIILNKLVPLNAEVVNGERIYRDQAGKLLSDRAVTMRSNKREAILTNWRESETILPSARMTGWGFVQAVSEIEQHANKGDATAQGDKLMDRVAVGRVGNLTERAWDELVPA